MDQREKYPAWVEGVVVSNAEEDAAVREGRAVLGEIKSAYGSTMRIVSINPRPEPVVTYVHPKDRKTRKGA